jgi:DNA polymerase III subunit epsilon
MNDLVTGDFVIFDVETTGLSPAYGDRVVEIAALRIRDFKPVAKFHSLVDPEREISYGAYLVNGITQEMLSGAPQGFEVFPDFLRFADDACLVGHNVRFDLNFLTYELSRLDLSLERTTHIIDTMRMARRFLPHLGRYSLLWVSQALGIDMKQQHRALADVELTFEVFKRLFQLAQFETIELDTLARQFGNIRK